MKQYHVGIYARLSRDDERQGESVSIENQKLMLCRYCEQQGWEVEGIYVDDGWSGTNFRRPGFQRLMEAVREKRVDLVLVKDLSRLGRDYIEVGKYTDCVFPCYGCRFIALNDGVDTLRQNDDVAMIFKNVINDIYARDTSRKIRAVRRSGAESGKFMGYKAPYGYRKDPRDKHRFVVDPPAAEIVRRIFDLREKGEGLQAIADRLTAENVLTPRDYAFGRSGHPWGRESVRAILGNEAYIGNLVQLKQGSLSYKDRRQRCRPPETWVRIDGTHQPLVDRQTWDTVRALEKNGYQPRRVKRADLFLGLLFCACCQKALKRTVNRKFRGGEWREYTYYICRSHVCIGADALRELLLRELRAHFALLMPQREEIAAEIKSDIEMKWRETHQRELREKAAHEKRLWELDRLLGRLYEDRMKEELSQETYQALLARYERERTTLREALEGVKALGMPLGIEGKDMEEWFTPQTVSPEQLKAFIEKIEVGKEGGLQIHYSFEEPVLL